MLASRLRNVYLVFLRSILIKKNNISCYIWYRSFIQMVKYSLLDQKNSFIIKVFMVHHSHLHVVIFYFKEKVWVSACVSKTCKMFIEDLVEKIISPE